MLVGKLVDLPRERQWPVVTALGIVQIFSWGSSYYLLAVLAAPIVADTGWSLSWVVAALSAGLLISGLISPRIGDAIGRHGGRPVLAAASILLALGLVIIATSPSLPVFLLGWAVLGLGMGAGLYDAAFATLGRIYGAAARTAISTLTLWGGFASTVCWPLSAYLVEQFGWRGACLTYAAIQLCVCLPLMIWILPRARVPAEAKAVDSIAEEPLTRQERRAFALLAAILVIGGITISLVSVHLLTLLQARGMSLASAVALGVFVGPAQVAARLLEMAGRGRHHPIWTLAAAMSLIAFGLSLLWIGFPLIAASLILYGAGNGIYSIARGTLPLALFGPARYPQLMGRLARPNLVAQAMAPLIGAVVLTYAGSSATLAFLTVLAVANMVLVGALWLGVSAMRASRVS